MKNHYKRVILLTVHTKNVHTHKCQTKCIVSPTDVSEDEEKSVGEKEQSYDLVQCKEHNFFLDLFRGRRRWFSFL